MEIILLTLGGILVISNIIFYTKSHNQDRKIQTLRSEKIIFEERVRVMSDKLSEQISKIQSLEDALTNSNIYKGRFDQSEVTIADLKSEIQNYKNNSDAANSRVSDYSNRYELLKQSFDNLEREKQEWSKEKENILHQISEELIRKNNEQQSKINLSQQEMMKRTTEDLMKNFEGVLNKVSSLNDDVGKSNEVINLTKNALLNPGGAGRTSEITLENILKASGLKQKANISDPGDFILQSYFSGQDKNGKRPDAILFLPNNQILIIDSKSSSHFLDLQQAKESKNIELENEISSKLRDSLKKHLEDLKRKDYARAKLEEMDLQHIFAPNSQTIISTIMFLQTEQMVEIVRKLDNSFEQKALEANIWVTGPLGLINLLNQTKFSIHRFKQEQNIELLRIEIRKLLDNISTIFRESKEIGKSISKALKSYNNFAGTFNNRLLTRINNIGKLGVETNQKHAIGKLEKYNIASDQEIIEGDLEEVEDLETAKLNDLS